MAEKPEKVLRGRDWDNDPLLGRISDTELAKLRGCSRQAVTWARRVREIELRSRDPHDLEGLDQAICQALSNRFEPRALEEIFYRVLHGYGTVSKREVQRRLLIMLEAGDLEVSWDSEYSLTAKKRRELEERQQKKLKLLDDLDEDE